MIPDIEKFLSVAIFKMATTIPHKFNIVTIRLRQKGILGVCGVTWAHDRKRILGGVKLVHDRREN